MRVADARRDVDALGAVVGAADVADRHDLALGLVQELGRVRADVAEALDRDARVLRLAAQPAEQS